MNMTAAATAPTMVMTAMIAVHTRTARRMRERLRRWVFLQYGGCCGGWITSWVTGPGKGIMGSMV